MAGAHECVGLGTKGLLGGN